MSPTRSLLALICILLSTASLAAQPPFTWSQLPGPYGGVVYGLWGGHGITYAYTSSTFSKVYRSTNHGVTWDAAIVGLEGEQVGSFAASGTNHYIGTRNGVFRSTLDGTIWTHVFRVEARLGIMSLVTRDSTVLALGNQDPRHDLFCSFDNGQTWDRRNPPLNEGDGERMRCIAVSASAMFAVREGSYRLYRSADRGETWSLLNLDLVSAMATSGSAILAARGMDIYRSTDDGLTWTVAERSTKYVMGFITTDSSLLARLSEGGVLETKDNGATWETVPSGAPGDMINMICSGDTCVMGVSGSSNGAFSTGQRIYRRIGAGGEWERINAPVINSGVNLLGVVGTTLFAQGDEQLFSRSTDGGLTWRESTPIPASITRMIEVDGALLASTSKGVYRSTDNGESWMESSTGLDLKSADYGLFDITTHGSALFTVSHGKVFRSTNSGAAWERLTNGLPAMPSSGFLRHYFVRLGSSLFVGSGGDLFRSTDGGDSWVDVSPGVGTMIGVVAVDSHLVAVTMNSGAYRSDDHGATWKMTANTGWNAHYPSRAVVFNGAIIVGTQLGEIAVSTDRGETWRTDTLPIVTTNQTVLSITCFDGACYAGTQWAGLFKGESHLLSADPIAIPEPISLACIPNPASGMLTIRYAVQTPAPVTLAIIDALGREVAVIPDAPEEAGTHALRFDAGALPAGLYFCRLGIGGVYRTTPVVVSH